MTGRHVGLVAAVAAGNADGTLADADRSPFIVHIDTECGAFHAGNEMRGLDFELPARTLINLEKNAAERLNDPSH